MRNIGNHSSNALLNQLKESLHSQPTKNGTKPPDLSPTDQHHVPPLTKTPTKKVILTENKMKPLSYSIRHHQDCHLNADNSKHRHHHLRQDKTESLHCDKQSTLIEIGLMLTLFQIWLVENTWPKRRSNNRRRSESCFPSNVQSMASRQEQLGFTGMSHSIFQHWTMHNA